MLRVIVQLVIVYGRREMKRPEEIHRGKHSMGILTGNFICGTEESYHNPVSKTAD